MRNTINIILICKKAFQLGLEVLFYYLYLASLVA